MSGQYRFVGEGAGVPGLPHELTDEEARRLGVEALLMEALKTGTYREIVGGEEQPIKSGRRVPSAGGTSGRG